MGVQNGSGKYDISTSRQQVYFTCGGGFPTSFLLSEFERMPGCKRERGLPDEPGGRLVRHGWTGGPIATRDR